ncbi:GAF domain-containing protein [Gloeocapsopsis dulcis]|uniref:PAS domain S-box protein n=1 Tax=Gloeocapsopsis dulcis AAB1 = 1H9 TaxID=1433147 RepID=A0A6N8FRF0_9CHRO|nr:GAF domain-containing protein [Gloeocapsopsis dulcis]MUL35172.1 hypothetical protein [Gloeocapsopsis dulcis AAB1 = 1H9]WNN89054.1 GAF domain-containing protein [Gloeocapsopsis dulcis]
MQRPQPETVTLNDVLITEELFKRSPRPPNLQAENQALRSLAQQMARDSQSLMQTLLDTALELCQAGTAGVSLLETTPDGEETFRWTVLAGTLAHYVGGSAPRNFSPCGVCLDQGTPVLFSHPERYFTYFQAANTPVVEGLVLPLVADHHVLGMIWIMSHDEQRQFDSEDVRIMTSLADFTATALHLNQRQTGELLAANAALAAKVEEHRQAEDQARALISNLPGGAAFVVDRNLRYLLAEGEALAIAGFKPEDLVGKTIFEVLPPDLAASYEVLYRQALAGEPFEHEHHAHDRFYISRGKPLRSANGEVYAVLVVSYDITERRQAEAAAAAEIEDTQRLRELGARLVSEDDIQTLYQEIVATAIALTHADAGTIQILEEETQEILLLASQGLEQKTVEYFYRLDASSNTVCGIALATRKRAMINYDVPASVDPGGSLQKLVEAGFLCGQSTPLISRSGRAIGMVSTHWGKHHRPTERELRFLDLLARQAADLIEQRQAQVALRESEEMFRTLTDTAPALIWFNDAQGNNRFINQHFLDFTGKSAEQIGGEGWHELVHPDEAELYIADYLAAVREQRSWQNRNRIRRHDGVWRWHDNYAQPLFSADGVYLGHVGVTIDNTDAIKAEIARRKSEDQQAFLLKLSDALRPLSDPAEIQGAATRLLCEHFDVGWCYYSEFDETGTIATILRDAMKEGLPSMVGVHDLSDVPEFTDFLHTGSVFNAPDISTFPLFNQRIVERYTAAGMESALGTPLVKNERLIALLVLIDTSPREWTDDTIALLEDVADRTWAALERARAEAALHESEAKYRSLFTMMNQGFCIIEKIETAGGQPSDFRYLTVNSAFEHHTGMHDVVGRTIREFVPDAEQRIVDIYDEVVRTGQHQHFEDYVSALDLWIDAEVFPAQMPGQIAVLFSNVSERNRSSERLRSAAEMDAFRVKLSDALRSLTDTVQIQAEASRLLGEHLGVDRAYYVEVNEAEGYTRVN